MCPALLLLQTPLNCINLLYLSNFQKLKGPFLPLEECLYFLVVKYKIIEFILP